MDSTLASHLWFPPIRGPWGYGRAGVRKRDRVGPRIGGNQRWL